MALRRRTTRRSNNRQVAHTSDISSATIQQLSALPVKTLRNQLATRHLPTSGNKSTLAQRLFHAIHDIPAPITTDSLSINHPATPTLTTTASNPIPSLPSLATLLPSASTSAADVGNITPAQISAMLQLLSQALQTSSTSQQSLPVTSAAMSSQPIVRAAPPIFSTAQQHVTTTTQLEPVPSVSTQAF